MKVEPNREFISERREGRMGWVGKGMWKRLLDIWVRWGWGGGGGGEGEGKRNFVRVLTFPLSLSMWAIIFYKPTIV